jgi:hypothetical protein
MFYRPLRASIARVEGEEGGKHLSKPHERLRDVSFNSPPSSTAYDEMRGHCTSNMERMRENVELGEGPNVCPSGGPWERQRTRCHTKDP